jgi:hypothetical protein
MRKKLLTLTLALGLAVAASPAAVSVQHYIICESCTTTDAIYPCKCGTSSRHPGVISTCHDWYNDCWNGFPP